MIIHSLTKNQVNISNQSEVLVHLKYIENPLKYFLIFIENSVCRPISTNLSPIHTLVFYIVAIVKYNTSKT
jgi:hypothetical protein